MQVWNVWHVYNVYDMYKLYIPQVSKHVICIVYMPHVIWHTCWKYNLPRSCLYMPDVLFRNIFFQWNVVWRFSEWDSRSVTKQFYYWIDHIKEELIEGNWQGIEKLIATILVCRFPLGSKRQYGNPFLYRFIHTE